MTVAAQFSDDFITGTDDTPRIPRDGPSEPSHGLVIRRQRRHPDYESSRLRGPALRRQC